MRSRTCCGTEERAFLAGVSNIVAVAGQTAIHAPSLGVGACPVAVHGRALRWDFAWL